MLASNATSDREFAFSRKDFDYLSTLAYERTGIVLKDHKFDMVYARVARRLRALGLHTVKQYCDLLGSDEGVAEIGHLVNALTTNLTSFFREGHHFEHLAKEVCEPFKLSGRTKLRLWSAGCSAGAEPYSMAMILRENLPNLNRLDCKILATDIDTTMLEKGRRGEYPDDWLEKIPTALRMKYVNGRRMAESLREVIAFKALNLLDNWPFNGPFDAIFCRNVVIYFDKETQRTLFNRIADKLTPEGYLYIGHSESLHNISDRFKLVGKTIYQRVS